MRKDRWIPALSVVLAIAAAFGGLYGMERLLEEKKHSLLSGSGSVAAVYPAMARDSGGEEVYRYGGTEKGMLSEDALVDVLEHMNAYDWEYLHEPAEGQLSMEQAMDRGSAWLDELSSLYGGSHGESGAYMRIQASLSTGGNAGEPDVSYSCWRLSFTGNDMEAALTLNGVTGQVLEAVVNCFSPLEGMTGGQAERALEWYCASFGLEPHPVEAAGNGLRCPAGPGGLYAAVEFSGNQVVYSADGRQVVRQYAYLHLFLDVEKTNSQSADMESSADEAP